jgi:hypothetical protein
MTNFAIKLELDLSDETMATKEQLIHEIDQMPDSMIEQVLEFVLSLKTKHSSESNSSDFWNAYLASKREREEVYRRLANS